MHMHMTMYMYKYTHNTHLKSIVGVTGGHNGPNLLLSFVCFSRY